MPIMLIIQQMVVFICKSTYLAYLCFCIVNFVRYGTPRYWTLLPIDIWAPENIPRLSHIIHFAHYLSIFPLYLDNCKPLSNQIRPNEKKKKKNNDNHPKCLWVVRILKKNCDNCPRNYLFLSFRSHFDLRGLQLSILIET